MTLKAFGIDQRLINQIKEKLKDPVKLDKAKKILNGVTREDLQNRTVLSRLLKQLSKELAIPLTARQGEGMIQYVIQQQIDPNNSWHLIKLWHKFH